MKLPTIGQYIPTMQPSYATPDEVLEAHGGSTFADLKYDGYRVQIHKGTDLIIFTRNSNELNYGCYPEIIKATEGLPKGIFEAELVGHGSTHKEVFDNVKRRFRRPGISDKSIEKYLASGVINETPLSLRLFDVLRFEQAGTLYLPFKERRAYVESLASSAIEPAETQLVTSKAQLEDVLANTFKARQEGRVCKNPQSAYIPGGNGLDWVKFKRSETLDLVVVGFYTNEAYRNDLPFTSVLCATYNAETRKYETLGKVGVTRNNVAGQINAEVAQNITKRRSSRVVWSEKLDSPSYQKFVPQSFIDPEKSVVLEVKAMNLNFADNWQTCGRKDGKAFSMRIGFVEQLRPDKKPRQATKTAVVKKLYELQKGD